MRILHTTPGYATRKSLHLDLGLLVLRLGAAGMLLTLHGWRKVINLAGGGRYSFDGWWAGRRRR